MELKVNLSEKSYRICIEDNLLNHIDSYLDINKRYFIVSDDGVPSEYQNKLKAQLPHADLLIIPQGEKSKNFDNYSLILSELLKHDYSRKDYLIALGGGVIGDLSGFAASTFKRGLHFIQIPTTFLAMVDSSVGGKVAIDFNNVKNAVGNFYQPDMVLIDPQSLKTLPRRHLYNGMVEAIKTGLIGDKQLFEIFKRDDFTKDINEIVYRSLDVKRKVVEQDEKELNLRKILNFGHTLGHAYESYFNMERYLHGEAVALGMLAISKDENYYQDLKKIIEKMGIDLNPQVDTQKMLDFIANDKKANQDNIDIILAHEVGKAEIKNVTIASLKKYLEK